MIVIAALGGLFTGLLVAAAWTAGCRQGRADVLSVTRALSDQPASIVSAAETARSFSVSDRYDGPKH